VIGYLCFWRMLATYTRCAEAKEAKGDKVVPLQGSPCAFSCIPYNRQMYFTGGCAPGISCVAKSKAQVPNSKGANPVAFSCLVTTQRLPVTKRVTGGTSFGPFAFALHTPQAQGRLSTLSVCSPADEGGARALGLECRCRALRPAAPAQGEAKQPLVCG
jgi:hypothetical protein